MILEILIILVILTILFLLIVIYENTHLVQTNLSLEFEHLPKNANGTSFVLLSDLHSNEYGKENETLLRMIDNANPDFIVIAGDMIVGSENCDYMVASNLLTKLASKYPIYYGFGNHEQKVEEYESKRVILASLNDSEICTREQYIRYLKKLGVTILDNRSACISIKNEPCIQITGCSIDLSYFKRVHRPKMTTEYLKQIIGMDRDEDRFQLLIAHNPMYFEEYAELGADLIVSGHIHGGMVRLPVLGGIISPQLKLFPKYDAGVFQWNHGKKKSTMVVSRGLGMHKLKLRFFNRPEIIKINLYRKG